MPGFGTCFSLLPSKDRGLAFLSLGFVEVAVEGLSRRPALGGGPQIHRRLLSLQIFRGFGLHALALGKDQGFGLALNSS